MVTSGRKIALFNWNMLVGFERKDEFEESKRVFAWPDVDASIRQIFVFEGGSADWLRAKIGRQSTIFEPPPYQFNFCVLKR